MLTTLATKLRVARKQAALTQEAVAKQLGVTRGAVTQWESKDPATRTQPPIDQIRRFAEITGAPFTWFIDDAQDADTYDQARAAQRSGSGQPAVTLEVVRRNGDDPTDSYSRQAHNFWSAVEYEACSQNPTLEAYFSVPIGRGELQSNADFYDGKTLAKFVPVAGQNARATIQRALGCVLVNERLAHKRLTLAILAWSPTPLTAEALEPIQLMALEVGVTVEFFSSPKSCAEYLLTHAAA